jgi:putative transposase
MLISLRTLLATLPWMVRSRAALELENLALRHQIGVLQRSARKRPKLTSGDRLFWTCLSRFWRDWHSALVIVKPETVVVGIGPAFACSGPGRCAAANGDDPSFPASSEN